MELPSILKSEGLTPLCQRAAGGAIATIIIRLSWGGGMVCSTTKKLAADETRSAIVGIAAPACAEHFVEKANDEKWAEYQKVDTWRRDTYIKGGGYVMMAGLAGDSSTSSAIADACVKALNKL